MQSIDSKFQNIERDFFTEFITSILKVIEANHLKFPEDLIEDILNIRVIDVDTIKINYYDGNTSALWKLSEEVVVFALKGLDGGLKLNLRHISGCNVTMDVTKNPHNQSTEKSTLGSLNRKSLQYLSHLTNEQGDFYIYLIS